MTKYLDLFAGAGGLSEGFVRAGYEPVAHVEMDVAACYSLKTRAACHWLKRNEKLNITPYLVTPKSHHQVYMRWSKEESVLVRVDNFMRNFDK